jgi:hypothetical protein
MYIAKIDFPVRVCNDGQQGFIFGLTEAASSAVRGRKERSFPSFMTHTVDLNADDQILTELCPYSSRRILEVNMPVGSMVNL